MPEETFQFLCTGCRKPIMAQPQWAGQAVNCPHCKQRQTVPAPSGAAPAAASAAGSDPWKAPPSAGGSRLIGLMLGLLPVLIIVGVFLWKPDYQGVDPAKVAGIWRVAVTATTGPTTYVTLRLSGDNTFTYARIGADQTVSVDGQWKIRSKKLILEASGAPARQLLGAEPVRWPIEVVDDKTLRLSTPGGVLTCSRQK